MAKNDKRINAKLNENDERIIEKLKETNENNKRINVKLNENNEKLDGFQNMVIALSETAKTVEIQFSKQESEILDFKAKVSHIEQKSFNRLHQERRALKVDERVFYRYQPCVA